MFLPSERGLDHDGVAKYFFADDAHLFVVRFVLDRGEGGMLEASLDVVWLQVGDDGNLFVHG